MTHAASYGQDPAYLDFVHSSCRATPGDYFTVGMMKND